MQNSILNKYGKSSENASKMMSKRGQKSMTNPCNFRTSDFLTFAESITFKSFFAHDQGYQKSIKINKNECKFDARKRDAKTWKVVQHGARMGAGIEKKTVKTRSEKRCEKEHTCKMGRRHVAGAFLRFNHLLSSRPRLVFVSFWLRRLSRLRLVESRNAF